MQKTKLIPLYKSIPPFMPFTEGYGYLGVLLMDKKTQKIQCHLCGKMFYNLDRHLYHSHEINGKEYKKRMELNTTTPLLCPRTTERLRDSFNSLPEVEKLEKIDFLRELNRDNKQKRGLFRKSKVTIQEKNIHGSCDLQIKHRFGKLYNELNRIPTTAELGRSLYGLILDRFETYDNALLALGISKKEIKDKEIKEKQKARENRPIHYFYDKEIVINSINNFKKVNMRLPNMSEFAKKNYLPTRQTMRRYLGIRTRSELISFFKK